MACSAQLIARMRVLLAGTLALLGAQLGRSPQVHASCVGPALDVLWSYPETGAEQVPTNVVIWVITSAWGAKPSVTLDGAPVDVQGAPTFSGVYLQAQQLTPNSDHSLVLDYARSPTALMPGAQTRFEIKFKTGAGPAEGAVDEPAVTGSARVLRDFADHDCADVIAAQDCFDTGQNALLSLDVEANAAHADETIGWLLQASYHGSSAIWPSRCGAPSVYIRDRESLCHHVQRIGAGGRLSEPIEHCSEPKPLTAAPTSTAGSQDPADQGSAPNPSTGGVLAVSAHDAGHSDAGRVESSPAGASAARAPASASCSAARDGRTASRAFWAIVAIALLLAHHQRQQRKRPRGCTPSRRFRL